MKKETAYKAGFVSVVGGPNVGKSTLVNSLVGNKVCTTSSKPNTTRDRIRGVFTDSEAQIVFADTPGITRPRGELRKRMAARALASLDGGQTLVVTDASKPFRRGEVTAIEKSSDACVVALNKIDLVQRSSILKTMEASAEFGEKISCIIPVSATGRKGLRELLDVLKKALPHRQKIFPKGAVSDRDESFLAAEFIREKIFRLTRGELPYGTTVVVNEFRRRKKGAIFVRADVILEREGQKKIVLGKEIFPKIGFYARRDIENLTGSRVFLELNVRVKKGWSEDPEFLNELYERN